MEASTNPFQPTLIELFERINALNGLLSVLNNQLNNYQETLNHAISEENRDLAPMGVGTSIVVRDLTERPEHGAAVYYPSGKFVARGEQYLNLIEVLVSRESAWSISQGYEAFETYLKDTIAVYLFENQAASDVKRLEKFKRDPKSHLLKENDLEFWKAFSRYAFQENRILLDYVRQIAPLVQEAEERNNRALDLVKWYEVVTKVREAATHSNFIIKAERIQSWTKQHKEILETNFSGEFNNGNYSLMLKPDNAETALKLFAEYAFAIFKSISIALNYDWQIFKKKGHETAV